MENDNALFGKNIRYLRKINNLKQDELAAKIYVTSQAVSKWETGKSLPDINMLLVISSLFQVNVESLLQEDLENKTIEKETKEEPLVDEASILEENETERPCRYTHVLDHNSKSYKVFFCSLIIFFVLILSYIPNWFYTFDIFTIIVIISQSIALLVLLVYQIKLLFHLKEVPDIYVDTTIARRRTAFKICIPILMATLIVVIAIFVCFEEVAKSNMFYYIYFLTTDVLIITDALVNCVSYDKILENAERE